jgi:hypothetical protein
MMEAQQTSETLSNLRQSTRRCNLEDGRSSGDVKGMELFDYLADRQLLKEAFAPWC